MADHYGLAAADIAARLTAGRMRVKSNADAQTAKSYYADLTNVELGLDFGANTPQSCEHPGSRSEQYAGRDLGFSSSDQVPSIDHLGR